MIIIIIFTHQRMGSYCLKKEGEREPNIFSIVRYSEKEKKEKNTGFFFVSNFFQKEKLKQYEEQPTYFIFYHSERIDVLSKE